MKKIFNIITFATLVIFLFIGFYGYSGNPVDPPKPVSNAATVTLPSASPTDECSDLMSLVPITVNVTITDCPDYKCQYPGLCNVDICVYEGITLKACQDFNPNQCSYTFDNLRAEEGNTMYCHFVVTPSGCLTGYFDGWSQGSQVPLGGGTVNLYIAWCE